jgi:hypothetical protein
MKRNETMNGLTQREIEVLLECLATEQECQQNALDDGFYQGEVGDETYQQELRDLKTKLQGGE